MNDRSRFEVEAALPVLDLTAFDSVRVPCMHPGAVTVAIRHDVDTGAGATTVESNLIEEDLLAVTEADAISVLHEPVVDVDLGGLLHSRAVDDGGVRDRAVESTGCGVRHELDALFTQRSDEREDHRARPVRT
jgi:hypothetical protein